MNGADHVLPALPPSRYFSHNSVNKQRTAFCVVCVFFPPGEIALPGTEPSTPPGSFERRSECPPLARQIGPNVKGGAGLMMMIIFFYE